MSYAKGPWRVEEDDFGVLFILANQDDIVANCTILNSRANAHRICQCVNNFDEVVGALRKAHECIVIRASVRENASEKDIAEDRKEIDQTIEMAEQALAKVEGNL